METSSVTSTGHKLVVSNKVVAAAAAVVVAARLVTRAVIATRGNSSNNTGIGYATEAHVMMDEDALQAAMDKAMENAENGNVGLMYKDNAYSTDGTNFQCYIVNSATNLYDMFITIYADADMTDELYNSQLVPPGSGFENLTLEHSLDVGDHVVYVAITQVDTDEETGEQSILRQVVYTMDFHVQ
jgi:hypothetical protein